VMKGDDSRNRMPSTMSLIARVGGAPGEPVVGSGRCIGGPREPMSLYGTIAAPRGRDACAAAVQEN